MPDARAAWVLRTFYAVRCHKTIHVTKTGLDPTRGGVLHLEVTLVSRAQSNARNRDNDKLSDSHIAVNKYLSPGGLGHNALAGRGIGRDGCAVPRRRRDPHLSGFSAWEPCCQVTPFGLRPCRTKRRLCHSRESPKDPGGGNPEKCRERIRPGAGKRSQQAVTPKKESEGHWDTRPRVGVSFLRKQ